MPKSDRWLRPMFHHSGAWQEAREVCLGLHAGADLVKVDTEQLVDDLVETLDGAGTYWIGAYKANWPWLNGEKSSHLKGEGKGKSRGIYI